MKLRTFKLAAAMAAFAAATAIAAPVEYKIPSSQADFDAQWEVVPGGVDGTWTWVEDATTPYAKTPVVAEGEVGATLILKEPISMKAGDLYFMQAKVSSDHYNNDVWFYIVYGTDKANLTPMKDDNYTFKCWGKNGGGADWKVKPTDSQDLRKLDITEDGDYYIGIRCKKGKGELWVASLLAEKSVDYPDRVTGGKAVATTEGLGATITWTWPTKTNNGNTLEGDINANIYRSTSDKKEELYIPENLVGVVKGGKPGEKGEFVDDEKNSLKPVTEPGKYYYYVAPFNEIGENGSCASNAIITCKWIGEETEFLPIISNSYNPAKATMVDETSVKIEYKPRKEAKNGGWFDESKVMLKVTRQIVGGEEVVVAENAPMVSPFIDNTLSEAGIYTYRLYVVYKDFESSATKIDPIFAGGTLPSPFSEDFSDQSGIEKFNVLSTNSSYKWKTTYSGQYLVLSGNTYTSGTSVLVTSPIKLEAGKTYRVACKSWADAPTSSGGSGWGWGDDYEDDDTGRNLTIVAGTDATIAGLKDVKTIAVMASTEANGEIVEAFFSPETSGIYYFGYKADLDSRSLYLDDVMIEEVVPSPAAIADLAVAVDPKGALSATVSFTVPSTTNAGMAIDGVDAVVVTRHAGENPVVVKELSGDECKAGAKIEFVDMVDEAGMYGYSVYSKIGDNESDIAKVAAAWVGYDIPKAVTAFSMRTDNDEKGFANIKWNAISGTVLGKNGGYVDADNLKYRVYRVDNLFGRDKEYVGETSGTTYYDDTLNDVEWSSYKYGVTVVNGNQESEMSETNVVSAGVIDPLKYEPDLTNENLVEALQGRSFTCDNGLVFKLRGATAGQEYMAYLPAFKVNEVTGRNFTIDLTTSRGDGAVEENLEVILCTVDAEKPAVESENAPDLEAAIIPGSDNRTVVETVPVTALEDAPEKSSVKISVPANGIYRVALRCASPDNKCLRVHALSMQKNVISGIDQIGADGNGVMIDAATGRIILPADAAESYLYRVDGTLVATGEAVAEFNVEGGIYIIRVITRDGRCITAKVAK